MREARTVLKGDGPIGVVLAGGQGRRMGGDKAAVVLGGRPLAQWVVDALGAVLDDVVVACRLETDLPALRGVAEAWVEPGGTQSPLTGVRSALREARGRPIVTCALSLPLVSPVAVQALLDVEVHRTPAVVPVIGGRTEAHLARWEPFVRPILDRLPATTPLDLAAGAAGAATVPFDPDDPGFFRVTAPEDLLRAAALLDRRRAHA